MIRFVAGPDKAVVPDLKNNLPGRGVWVGKSRILVDEAVKRNLFARGLKVGVEVDFKLGELVDELMERSALGALGFAKKAGECVTGSQKVETTVLNRNAIGVIHALDGADDGLRKLTQATHALQRDGGKTIRIWRVFSGQQMNLALGATHVIHAALTKGGAARNCLQRIKELAAYRGSE